MTEAATSVDRDLLKAKAKEGDPDSMVKLASLSVETSLTDRDELSDVREILLEAHNGHGKTIWCAAVLAVLTDHRRAWDYTAEIFGSDMDPGLGYIAYDFLKKSGAKAEELEKWHFLVELSARQGFILAKRDLWIEKCRKLGFAGSLVKYPYVICLAFQVLILTIRNSDDPRLPYSARVIRGQQSLG